MNNLTSRWCIANILLALILYSFIKLGRQSLTKMQLANLALLFISFNMFIYEAKQ